jgi:uncharacterized protein YsxB (DUF464 family)
LRLSASSTLLLNFLLSIENVEDSRSITQQNREGMTQKQRKLEGTDKEDINVLAMHDSVKRR